MTDSLSDLRALVADLRGRGERELSSSQDMAAALRRVQDHASSAGAAVASRDLQELAVKEFWRTGRLTSLREGRLVAFGAWLPSGPGGISVIDDKPKLSALLTGVDQWSGEPRRFRRCYQGLVVSYFEYDPWSQLAKESGVNNWRELGGYLESRADMIGADGVGPAWVRSASENRQLFGDDPCEQYAAEMLAGRNERVEQVRTHLGVPTSSWFLRELVFAQIKAASDGSDGDFVAALPHLLPMVSANPVLRDRGIALILDRYAAMSAPPVHQGLLDSVVGVWGNPWITSNQMRWGKVSRPAREMVADWLKLEFIERFFTLLSEEHSGEQRRLAFWKRYVRAIDDIHFALGSEAFYSRNRDFVELRSKMAGRVVELIDSAPGNNAFVMKLGNLVIVEFSGRANALYGYDQSQTLPFDLTKPVVTPIGARNSLKHSGRQLKMRHQDGIHGCATWEERFETRLRDEYRIIPSDPMPIRRARTGPYSATQTWGVTPRTVPRPVVPQDSSAAVYSRHALDTLARGKGLRIEDNSSMGGNLWVLSAVWSAEVETVLARWGFRFRMGRGWWK
jgi:hypothetical protein